MLLADYAMNDATLRKHLLGKIDGLRDTLVTDRLLAAGMILDWASNAGNFAMDGELARATTDFVQKASAAEAYYDQFLPKKGAVYCAGMALFYDHLLKMFGYESFTINFGDMRDDFLTHVTVIVPVLDDTAWKHLIFDPTFNTTFHDQATGCQLDMFELIDALDGKTLDAVVAVAESTDSRDWISVGPCRFEYDLVLRNVVGDHYVYGRSDDKLTDYMEGIASVLAANEYASDLRGFVQLLRARIFGMGSSTSEAATQDFTRQLQVRGIPLGSASRS